MAQYAPVPVSRANIDWGVVLSSRLVALRISEFDAGDDGRSPPSRRRLQLDGSGHGAADPAALAVSPDGTKVLIALAGAHQLLLVDRTLGPRPSPADVLPLGDAQRLTAVDVGRTPVALVLDPGGTIAVTADAMADTLSVVGIEGMSLVATVRLGPSASEGTADRRGEALFRDGRRALDRWMSCASCHADGHTNGLNFDTLGDGTYGGPKNTPALLGVGATGPFSWTGRVSTLGEQVHQSLSTTLHGPQPEAGPVDDLTAYLATLAPPPPRRRPDDPDVRRGERVFRARRCDSCHVPPLYTSPAARDVGLEDGAAGHRRFNPPSLRGVARTAPYLHDGRAATLGAVLDVHSPRRWPRGRPAIGPT
jgi:mono/diheme cytochrome c family protein